MQQCWLQLSHRCGVGWGECLPPVKNIYSLLLRACEVPAWYAPSRYTLEFHVTLLERRDGAGVRRYLGHIQSHHHHEGIHIEHRGLGG